MSVRATSTHWREQQVEPACLRRSFGREARLDAAIARSLKELEYGG